VTVRIINADVFEGLAQLEDESVQCCVTSPPYWGLRDYGTARWEGASSSCDHVSHTIRTGAGMEALGEKYRGGGKKATPEKLIQFAEVCGKCGAARVDQQLGLEPTPEAFVEKTVAVFKEVRRVLRKDGVLFLNIGDSYASQPSWGRGGGSTLDGRKQGNEGGAAVCRAKLPGLKQKDLIGIPWMLAFALRADGWYLRQEIIWNKPNPMPESVTDRCTKAHEHIFLLSKSARYYFDAGAIKELADPVNFRDSATARRNPPPGCATDSGFANGRHYSRRNKRSVWTMATQPYSEAHFATFPEELPATCIKAGSRIGDTILDPFGGAGTTGLVADKLNRNAVLIELNPEYAAMAKKRIHTSAPLFAELETLSSEQISLLESHRSNGE